MKFREFIQFLDEEGELIRVKKEVSPILEMANILNSLDERPTLFERVKVLILELWEV